MSECWCGARGAAPCRTKAGRPLRQPHKTRAAVDLDPRPRLGSLFSGYGGLDLGVSAVTGARTVWVSDIDGQPTKKRSTLKGACAILEHRFPGVPNLGDISHVDWDEVEDVEILTGGFPCQDVSHAGKRAGMIRGETRTGLWAMMLGAIVAKQPRLVVAENVKGLLNAKADCDLEPCPWCVGDEPDGYLRALGAVLADLADVGYDARWTSIRASDLGAPHQRLRVFIVAYPAGTDGDLPGLIRPGTEVLTGGYPELELLFSTPDTIPEAPNYTANLRGRKLYGLGNQAASLPTPTAQDAKGHTPENRDHRLEQGRQLQLAHVVPLPTPTATGTEANQRRAETAGQTLGQAAGLFGDRNKARPNDPPPLLLPTPLEDDGSNVARSSGSFGSLTRTVQEDLLPTPVATDAKGAARDTSEHREMHGGSSLTDATRLLPTPKATNNENDNSEAWLGSPNLGTAIRSELLPTPTAWEQRSDPAEDDRNLLPLAVQRIDEVPLLPTPAVNDMGTGMTVDEWDEWNTGPAMSHQMHGQPLSIVAQDLERDAKPSASRRALLPTPLTADATPGPIDPEHRKKHGQPEQVADVARQHADGWGQYGPAVRRWESILGRAADRPTIPGTKAGKDGVIRPRLNSRFVEWMMGLAPGWVTDVPGLSRNEHLHALGNGVVPQQAAAAVLDLLTAAALTDEEVSQ